MKPEESDDYGCEEGSPPAWGRGLKLYSANVARLRPCVAPRVGAWIETMYLSSLHRLFRRPPRGGVD